jgi:hypothetical protein
MPSCAIVQAFSVPIAEYPQELAAAAALDFPQYEEIEPVLVNRI